MIRAAGTADIPRLAEIHVGGWRFAYRGIVPDHELFVERTVEGLMKRWLWMLEHEVPAMVWDDGLLKGFVIHNRCRDDDALGAHEVQALYVEPAFVREGVGSALIRAAEHAGLDQGRRDCRLWVLEANTRGRAFYEKHGYRLDGGLKVIEEWGGAGELRYAKALPTDG